MIWDFQDALTRRLLLWSAFSAAAGALLLVFGDAFWRGFGLQALAWGAIDAAIAIFGRQSAKKRLLKHIAEGGSAGELAEREVSNLRRLLWINTGLDVLYIAGGVLLAGTLGQSDPFARGNGWGIVVQGAFLFLFDLLHAFAVPRREPAMPRFDALGGPEHESFILKGGAQAALLLHGFLGTPAELRGLGKALQEQGWTVHAPLLPGFGSDIQTLTTRQWQEWAAVAQKGIEELEAQGHSPVMLAGYSMGASLSLLAGRDSVVKGLVLLAPFSWPQPWWVRPAEFVVRPFLPLGFRPMRKADFSSAEVRQEITGFMPGVDLDDPQVQAAIRDFRVPLGLIDQLRSVSAAALAAAPGVDHPVLVVQGVRDRVARPEHTARLIARLPERPAYVEVDSDHKLTDVTNPAWPAIRQAVLDFAGRITANTG